MNSNRGEQEENVRASVLDAATTSMDSVRAVVPEENDRATSNGQILDATFMEKEDDEDILIEMSQIDFTVVEDEHDLKVKEVEEAKRAAIKQKTLEFENRQLQWKLQRSTMEQSVIAEKLRQEMWEKSAVGIATRKYQEAVVLTNGARQITKW